MNDVFKFSGSKGLVVAGHALNRLAMAADDVMMGRISEIIAISFANSFTKDNPRFFERLEVAVNGNQVNPLF